MLKNFATASVLMWMLGAQLENTTSIFVDNISEKTNSKPNTSSQIISNNKDIENSVKQTQQIKYRVRRKYKQTMIKISLCLVLKENKP